jgi:hypothetical protein
MSFLANTLAVWICTKILIEIARCYGCGVTKKAVEHQFYGQIKQEVDVIKGAITTTGQGQPELTQVGTSKGSKGQSCEVLPYSAHALIATSILRA